MNNKLNTIEVSCFSILIFAFHTHNKTFVLTPELHNSLTPKTNHFCLMKMLIGEPVSFQFSRILFSRKRL